MTATDHTEATDYTERTELSLSVRLLARLLPGADRESILGDLVEDADVRDLRGAGRVWWLTAECGTIAAGLSIQRVRAWFVLPPMREVAAGLAVDRRGALRGDTLGTVVRALVFCGSVATLALGVELLVRTLFSAAGL
jgi:hypothetical protein